MTSLLAVCAACWAAGERSQSPQNCRQCAESYAERHTAQNPGHTVRIVGDET